MLLRGPDFASVDLLGEEQEQRVSLTCTATGDTLTSMRHGVTAEAVLKEVRELRVAERHVLLFVAEGHDDVAEGGEDLLMAWASCICTPLAPLNPTRSDPARSMSTRRPARVWPVDGWRAHEEKPVAARGLRVAVGGGHAAVGLRLGQKLLRPPAWPRV